MKNNSVSRRMFIQLGTAVGGAFGLGLTEFGQVRAAVPQFGGTIPGFGPLVPTAAENTGETLLKLPEGFKYNVLIRNGNIMSDGRPFPSNADGMGAFDYNGMVRLVACHERSTGPAIGSFPYDPGAGGGTTTLTVDPTTRLLTESFVSSSGHVRNCAGGITPWGTWLTCEETTQGPTSTYQRQHGYIFEVPAFASTEVPTEPLRHLGLHYPEAAVVDPKTGIVYITSDRGPCGTFRFVPSVPGDLTQPGRVQMLAIEGMPQYGWPRAAPRSPAAKAPGTAATASSSPARTAATPASARSSSCTSRTTTCRSSSWCSSRPTPRRWRRRTTCACRRAATT